VSPGVARLLALPVQVPAQFRDLFVPFDEAFLSGSELGLRLIGLALGSVEFGGRVVARRHGLSEAGSQPGRFSF
jgi:hypothetical protein